MASEIFGTAALFWVLIPVGLAGGALLLKLDASEFEKCALVRQGDLDRVVPSDDRDRRESTLRARLEGAVDSAAGDTNAADALRRLEAALKSHDEPLLNFSGTVENAFKRLELSRNIEHNALQALDAEQRRTEGPLQVIASHVEEQVSLQRTIAALEAEARAGQVVEWRRVLDDDDRRRRELAALEAELAALDGAAAVPADAESVLREAYARHDDAMRRVEDERERGVAAVDRELTALEGERRALAPFRDEPADRADARVALADAWRRAVRLEGEVRAQLTALREQLAAKGHVLERMPGLAARYAGLPEESQRDLRDREARTAALEAEARENERATLDADELVRLAHEQRRERRMPALVATVLAVLAAAGGVLAEVMHTGMPLAILGFAVAAALAGTAIVLQRQGRAYLKKRLAGSVEPFSPMLLTKSTTAPKLVLPLALPTPVLLPLSL